MDFNIQLRKFDLDRIDDYSTVAIIGRRATGKSFLTRDIMYHKRHIPIGTVISGTEYANKFYSKEMVPPQFIYDDYNPEITEKVVERQKKATRRGWRNPGCFLIMDDCIYDDSFINDPNILQISRGFWKTLYILTMQETLSMPIRYRNNFDFIFILKETYLQNRKRIYDNYAGMFPTFDIFCRVMDACTQNYECLVIHNTSKSNKLEDQVFYYKAKDHKPFSVGCKEWWNHARKNGKCSPFITAEDDIPKTEEEIEAERIEREIELEYLQKRHAAEKVIGRFLIAVVKKIRIEKKRAEAKETAERIERLKNVKSGECVVCMEDGAADHIIVPCGHICLCKWCKDELNNLNHKCPVCCQKIQMVMKVYFPTNNEL